jgi:hypothetical protein
VGLSQFNVALALSLAQFVVASRVRKKAPNKGLGLIERGLILLFFEWVALLDILVLTLPSL